MNKLTWLGAIVLISAFVVGCNGLDKNADENKSDASRKYHAKIVAKVFFFYFAAVRVCTYYHNKWEKN